jgi:tyrosine-protein kinase Etk/Wzc
LAQYELNLRDFLRIFHKRKLIIVGSFLVVTTSTVAYLSTQQPVYKTSTTVKILERQSIAGLLTEWIVYSPADVMESQTKIIEGYPIMKKVAQRLGFIDDSTPIAEVHNVVVDLQRRIIAETVKRTNIIRITATTSSAKAAVELARTVAEVYVEENLLEKKKQASSARRFIEEQLLQLEERLKAGEERLKELGRTASDVALSGSTQKKMVDLEFQLATLLKKYTDKHPHVIQLKEQITDLEGHMTNFTGDELEYSRYAREVEVNKKLYSMFKERLEETRITEAEKVGDASIVDPAVMPRAPVSAQKHLSALVGGMAGLMLGFILAILFETLDTSIGTIEDVENSVKLPVLGVIPSIPSDPEHGKSVLKQFKKKISRIRKTKMQEAYTRLIVHHKPKSTMAEAYRHLRTNLKLHKSRGLFLITSAGPREGKTTVLVNLGLAVAQKGVKTLLISSDLRRPALAKTFGIKKEPGLNEVITGTARLEDAIRSIADIMLGDMELRHVMKTPGMENIWILTSGHVPLNPAEILESDELHRLVEELKQKFDVILFDSPPVLLVTDACLIASKVDGVVLCYEIGRMARDALMRAKAQLELAGAKISGVVLNHITPQTEPMTYYPYYRYRYRYKYRYYADDAERAERVKVT